MCDETVCGAMDMDPCMECHEKKCGGQNGDDACHKQCADTVCACMQTAGGDQGKQAACKELLPDAPAAATNGGNGKYAACMDTAGGDKGKQAACKAFLPAPPGASEAGEGLSLGDYCLGYYSAGGRCPSGSICEDPKKPGLNVNSCSPGSCTCVAVEDE